MSGVSSTTKVSSAKEQQPNLRSVLVMVRNFWTRKEEWSWNLACGEPFRSIHKCCVEMRGDDGFDLSLNGRRLKLNETPSSLEIKNRVELLCVPVPVVTIVLKDNDNNGLHIFEREIVVRRDQKLTKLGFFHKEARIFVYGNRKLSLQETPESLQMSDYEEIYCVPSSSVMIDIFNVEAQEVSTIILGCSSYFRHILMDEKNRPHYEPSFYLEFDGSRIHYDDTPRSLGMEGGDRLELSYTPNPVVEIELYKDGEPKTFMRTFRLRPHQPLRTIYNAYRDMSFQLMFKDSRVPPEATLESLGIKGSQYVELLLVPAKGQQLDDKDDAANSPKCVVIDIRDEKSGAIECTFKTLRSTKLKKVFDAFRERRGKEDSFILKFGEESVGYSDTPDSLGMETHDELTCVPDTNMACAEEDEGSTIDIVFLDPDEENINHIVLRHGYNEKMKTLFSKYAAMREIPLKSLRFKYDDKVLFLSSIGKMPPRDLGMQNNDVIYASRFESIGMKRNEIETKKSRPSRGVGTKKGKAKSKKKTTDQPSYSTMNEEERLRREHSNMLSVVFDEANPQFKEIRQKLNSLALEQTPPKVKLLSPRVRARQPTSADLSDISSVSLDNKAIKTRFNVIVGEVSNLYKSTKPSKNIKAHEVNFTIDLHGYSKEAAVAELDTILPSWVDAAMRGDYPFVIPVTIICGAGGQVLSEVVEKWIRENERVANARKNMFI